MDVFSPTYYRSFRCVAASCPDSCCKEWAVDVDSQSAAYYRALPGDLGNRLRAVLQDTEDGTVMTIENGRCPMWRQDGLCRIQAELGHDALCQTCRDFPRLRHDYGDFVELGLELSCPEAARLILTSTEQHMLFSSHPGGEAPDYDAEVMRILRHSRKETLDFLYNSSYSLPETIAVILLHSHSVQSQIDGADPIPIEPELCLAEAKKHIEGADAKAIFAFFQKLEILTPEWENRLAQPPVSIRWTPHLRALMGYMIGRYWLQAISDYDLICRVKFAVTACLLVGSLGGDPIATAQLFSKEIENDLDNVDAIWDGAYSAPALTDRNLLSLLLA